MRKNAFTKPSRGTSRARVELQSTETLSFRCCSERCHLSRGAVAFTLAEVLITLGIIGVVAVLTIPALVAQNQEKGWDTASSVFEAKLGEALRVMNTQQVLAKHKTTEDFVNELTNHIKVIKTCENDDLASCFEDTITWQTSESTEDIDISTIKYGYQMGNDDWDTKTMGLQFANGTNAIVAYNPKCSANPYDNNSVSISGGVSGNNGTARLSTDCIAIVYDTSGYANPNTSNKDVRFINVKSFNNKKVFKAGSHWYGTPFMPKVPTKEECLKYLDEEVCAAGNGGYWGGAVVQCGGVDKIPNRAALGEIAGYFCDRSAYSTGNYYNSCNLNMNKIQQAGLIPRSSGTYQIFGDRTTGTAVNTLFIEPNGTIYNQSQYPSGYNTFQAVCIVD